MINSHNYHPTQSLWPAVLYNSGWICVHELLSACVYIIMFASPVMTKSDPNPNVICWYVRCDCWTVRMGGQGMGCEWLAGSASRVCLYVGLYRWEGLGGLGPGCKWLAGLVWEGLQGQGLGCEH